MESYRRTVANLCERNKMQNKPNGNNKCSMNCIDDIVVCTTTMFGVLRSGHRKNMPFHLLLLLIPMAWTCDCYGLFLWLGRLGHLWLEHLCLGHLWLGHLWLGHLMDLLLWRTGSREAEVSFGGASERSASAGLKKARLSIF